MIGSSLGPYEIKETLGVGGMGEVYLAEDTRLGRKVAIKVLPAEFAGDPERLARFEQEARAAAALNHPHIAVVYDIGHEPGGGDGTPDAAAEAGGTGEPGPGIHYIVQEYLQGEPLRAPLDKGALHAKRALMLSIEIAEALAAAHAAGIVHRDLKPDNVFVTEQGHAKVLDFGLAKLTEVSPAVGSASMSPTMLGTVAGQVMGTAGYMAPEQVNGEKIDARADLFAFGCLLYEMATGKRAFAGKNLPETLHRLVNTSPIPLNEAAPALPLQLQWIVDKSLAKDPADRYQAAGDLIVDLRRLAADVEGGRAVAAADVTGPVPPAAAGVAGGSGGAADGAATARTGVDISEAVAVPGEPGVAAAMAAGAAASSSTTVSRFLPWAVAGVAVIIAVAALASGGLGGSGAGAPGVGGSSAGTVSPTFLPLRETVDFGDADARSLEISPDGRRVALILDNQLHVWDLGDPGGPRPVRGTRGAMLPFFSPDGDWVGFFANRELLRVQPGGALPVTMASGASPNPAGAVWGRDNQVVYIAAWGFDFMSVDAFSGAEPEVVAVLDAAAGEQGYTDLQLLPDGDHLLHSMWDDQWNVQVRSLSTGEKRVLIPGSHGARYLPTGHLAYAQDNALLVSRFNAETLQLEGAPAVLIGDLVTTLGWGAAWYAFSDEGTMVYLSGGEDLSLDLVRIDVDTEERTLLGVPDRYGRIRIAPDMQSAAVEIDDSRLGRNLSLLDLSLNRFTALTTGANWVYSAAFSSDSSQLLMCVENSGYTGLRRQRVDGVGTETEMLEEIRVDSLDWGADGTIVFSRADREMAVASQNIWVSRGDDEPVPVAQTSAAEDYPAMSPDGRHLAYQSDGSGRNEIYVVPLEGVAGQPWPVSIDGGERPRWKNDGSEIYFRVGDRLLVAEVLEGSPFRTAAPEVLIDGGIDFYWDISGDGSFVITREVPEPPRLNIVFNWFAEIERLLPPER